MNAIDLGDLLAVLDPDHRGGRRTIDQFATAVRSLARHTDHTDIPALVLDTVRRGEQANLWTPTRATVHRGATTLPKSIRVTAAAAATDRRLPVDTALRPELASWASGLRLSSSQREVLLAVNDWLRRTDGGKVPVVASAERAFQLLRQEKAFDSTPPRGGTALWGPGRLTLALLRCQRVPTPLTWEPVTPRHDSPGPILCVENHATFRSLIRVMRESPSPTWAAIAWVQGNNTAPLDSLPDLPFPITRLDYLGDLDAAGLSIAAAACATSGLRGIPSGPAVRLWELLLDQPPGSGKSIQPDQAALLTTWLPAELRNRATALLTAGLRIPQEALRYDILRTTLIPLSGLPSANRSSSAP